MQAALMVAWLTPSKALMPFQVVHPFDEVVVS
jgi:hypothetical protein